MTEVTYAHASTVEICTAPAEVTLSSVITFQPAPGFAERFHHSHLRTGSVAPNERWGIFDLQFVGAPSAVWCNYTTATITFPSTGSTQSASPTKCQAEI